MAEGIQELDSKISELELKLIEITNTIRDLTAQRDLVIHEDSAKAILADLSPAQRDVLVKALAVDTKHALP